MLNFDQYRKYDTIIITGAQRSGTQITAKIFAHELGKRFVAESRFNVHNFEMMTVWFGDSVIHAPALCHMVGFIPQDICVVFVVRDYDEIIASQQRIGWNDDELEKNKYSDQFEIDRDKPICQIKHEIFLEHHLQLPNTTMFSYDDLQDHPMFIKKELRKDFTAWQTERK